MQRTGCVQRAPVSPCGTLILVSNEVPFSFPEEQALCTVLEEKNDCYLVRDSTVQLAPEAMEALNQWMEDFLAQGGSKTVNVVAGHRTEAFQQHLFDQSADRNGLEHAQHYVALPGRSEHHTGYALDLSLYFSDGTSADFDGTGSYAWLAQHAADYGFVLRYPADKESVTGISYESWHYRYVGRPHAPGNGRQGPLPGGIPGPPAAVFQGRSSLRHGRWPRLSGLFLSGKRPAGPRWQRLYALRQQCGRFSCHTSLIVAFFFLTYRTLFR